VQHANPRTVAVAEVARAAMATMDFHMMFKKVLRFGCGLESGAACVGEMPFHWGHS
jgi:hypothetical protein